MAKVSILTTVDNFNKMHKAMKILKNNSVYVGVVQNKSSRETDSITNAELLYIHSMGSPINNLPARPVVEPAIKESSETIAKMFKVAGKLAFDEKEDEAVQQLKKIGMKGQNVSRGWFVNPNNGWQPNSLSVRAKKAKKGSTEPRPLIDTGELRKSITYFVDTEGGRIE